MQRLLPFACKTVLSKVLAQNSSSTTSPSSRIILQPLAQRHFCSSNGSRNDPGSKPQDPWDQPWQNKQQQKQNPDFSTPFEPIGSSWSTGITEEEFEEEEAVGRPVENIDEGLISTATTEELDKTNSVKGEGFFDDSEEWARVEAQYGESKKFVESIDGKIDEMEVLLTQVREPGLRGAYLKDSEKQEMYKLHKENPEVYTVERLAKDFRVMRQRVLAILWLKEDEEEMEKKMGPLDDSVERLLDAIAYPEFANFGDREFHVAQLPNNPDFKVMPEDWDGTAKDPDEIAMGDISEGG
ncbi:hypothetical protein KI387_011174 [Taxus chinensis]|uniref:Uncharacterized protein n=1 Tax=Taxus chinensis TaxID=29808 RepID=A0AA38KXH2_TAXCH|nr:hypothetical protein KI387_011174 [Taxus chinensis]